MDLKEQVIRLQQELYGSIGKTVRHQGTQTWEAGRAPVHHRAAQTEPLIVTLGPVVSPEDDRLLEDEPMQV